MTKYRVTAQTGFDGRPQGEEFEADLDEELEARAVERGSIEIVKGGRKATKDEEEVSGDG